MQARKTSGTARVAQDVQAFFPYAHFQYFFSEKFQGCQGASLTTFFLHRSKKGLLAATKRMAFHPELKP